eukprot:CAMPEP_0168414874 /NCGR_PEP_ID=MMETSP0228-20121227/29949_1 /TAXON_ID=133427 /ORGANISM="Protoceratium reticulatum, Strain CCCM 535 (=CCMP 1889)" /LENGTH=508 /DNA_ID=CAMNT_0008428681 /DNA_START=46 /DNA_END=1569 /DNA_ORIENTATION=+
MTFVALFVPVSLAALATGSDVGYNRLYQTAPEEFSHRCVAVERAFPDWAEGDFVISSVGRFEMGGRRFTGFADAFGKMHRFELKGSTVCATYRMMGTGFYNESLKAGTIGKGLLFYETEPPRSCPWGEAICKVQNLAAPNDNTFVNTMRVGPHLVTLTDSPVAIEVDARTLNVVGNYKWEDSLVSMRVPYSGSAHPLPHPSTGDMVDFVGTENVMTGESTIRMYTLSDKSPKERRSLVDIPDGSPPYMHSFGLTAQHVVLPRMPVRFDFAGAALRTMAQAFQEIPINAPSADNAFHVVPLGGGKPIVRMLPESDRLYYTHTVNTYENASGIVIDLSTAPSNPFSRNLSVAAVTDEATRNSDKAAHMVVRRFLVPLDHDAPVRSEALSDPRMATDFTRINPRVAGRKHCFFWAVQWFSDAASFASMAVVKHDVCNGGVRKWERKNWYPSEPTLLPAGEEGAAEDAGLLVFTALDGRKDETYLLVVDASTMQTVSEAGPYPRIGFTTHGE